MRSWERPDLVHGLVIGLINHDFAKVKTVWKQADQEYQRHRLTSIAAAEFWRSFLEFVASASENLGKFEAQKENHLFIDKPEVAQMLKFIRAKHLADKPVKLRNFKGSRRILNLLLQRAFIQITPWSQHLVLGPIFYRLVEEHSKFCARPASCVFNKKR